MVMAQDRKRNGVKKVAKLRSRLEILIAQYNVDRKGDEKLTQKLLAEETGLSENTISRLIRNDFAQIEADTIEKLCTFFELDDLDELLVVIRE
jgi:DNA-binding Xre family transcriptional regulator